MVVLNKRGWVGYLLPHATEAKLYCHYHRQEHMDGESWEDFVAYSVDTCTRLLPWYGVGELLPSNGVNLRVDESTAAVSAMTKGPGGVAPRCARGTNSS